MHYDLLVNPASQFFIIATFFLGQFGHADNCEYPLTSAKKISAPNFAQFRSSSNRSLLTFRKFQDRGFTVETVKSHQVTKPLNSSYPLADQERITNLSNEIAALVRRNYPRRGWEESFIQGVSANIQSYFDHSDFILIRDAKTQELLASIRIISAPFRVGKSAAGQMAILPFISGQKLDQLPVEKGFLKDTLDRAQIFSQENLDQSSETLSAIFEVSSLVISMENQDKTIETSRRKTLAALLYKYFLFLSFQASASDSLSNGAISLFSTLINHPQDKVIFAYGDRVGRVMYSPYGFKPMPEIPEVQLMGEPWNVFRSGHSMFSNVRKRLQLDKFAGEALALLRKTDTPGLVDQISLDGIFYPDEFWRRFNAFLGGITPQLLRSLEKEYLRTGIPPRTYYFE